jgi:hypothetical protein
MEACPAVDIVDELVVKSGRIGKYDVSERRWSVDDCPPEDASDVPFAPVLLTKRVRIYHETFNGGLVLANYGFPQVALQITEESHLRISFLADLSVEDEVADVCSLEFKSH